MWKSSVLSLISGILLTLPFPPFNLEIAAWLCLTPLLIAVMRENPRNSFLLGYLVGIIWNIGSLYWMHVYHPLALPLVVLILSFYPAFFCLGLNKFCKDLIPEPGQEQVYQLHHSRSHIPLPDRQECHPRKQGNMKPALQIMFAAPLLWTSLEYIRSLGFLGFPWNSLGYSQYKFLPVIQMAEFTGVFGLSFLIVFVNSGIALAFKSFHRPKSALKIMIVVGTALGLCISWGSFMIKKPYKLTQAKACDYQVAATFRLREKGNSHVTKREREPIRVALIQPNFGTDCQWYENSSMIMEKLTTLSFEAGLENPDLIIWPESAIGENPFKIYPRLSPFSPPNLSLSSPSPYPAMPRRQAGGRRAAGGRHTGDRQAPSGRIEETERWLREKIQQVLKETGAHLLTGAPYSSDGKDYNSAFLISPSGELLGRYDKIHLVPAGEYFPFWRYSRLLEYLLQEAGDFTPGEKHTIFEIPGKGNFYEIPRKGNFHKSVKFSVLICFEGIFGDLTRRFVNEGADFLVNITNDAWSHSKTSHYQHASIATFRAVENRTYFVRAGNSGVSRVIKPTGMIEKNLDYNKTGILVGEISPSSRRTFYTRHGDIFSKLILAMTLLSFVYAAGRKLPLF